MHLRTQPKKVLSLLLVLAMLTLLFSALLPVAVSAEPMSVNDGEIEDFGCQTLAALDLPNDEDTDLRLLFTVGSLDYDEVGFVLSKSVAVPTIGEDGCHKVPTTTVYRSIMADGKTENASDGRYWVVVKLTDVPHAYFDGAIYVRPYVTDGEITRYAAAASFTVCSAAGHLHEVTDENMTGGTATLVTAGTKIGHCAACNLDVTLTDVKTTGIENRYDSSSFNAKGFEKTYFSDILDGGKHFWNGSDLLIEYSILYNTSLLNLNPDTNRGKHHPYVTARLGNTSSTESPVVYWSPTVITNYSDCPYPGGFDTTGNFKTLISDDEVTTPVGMASVGGAYADYPNIGGTTAFDPDALDNGHEWGWHRIGIRVRLDVANEAAVIAGAGSVDATYVATVTVYIDGAAAFKYKTAAKDADTVIGQSGLALFTAEYDGAGGLSYDDIDGECYVYPLMLHSRQANTDTTVYFVYADVNVTCGTDFVQSVERVANPANNTYTTSDDQIISAKVYYAPVLP